MSGWDYFDSGEFTDKGSVLLRGTIVNTRSRTYGVHKNLYSQPVLPTIFGPINYGPPY